MTYLVGLFLILGIVFYSFNLSGGNINILNSAQHSVGSVLGSLESKLYNSVFPKSQNEILVNKLNSSNNVLSKFFNNSVLCKDSIMQGQSLHELLNSIAILCKDSPCMNKMLPNETAILTIC